MPEASGPRRNAAIVRNALAPFGFGRRGAVCFVAARLRYTRIALLASPRIRRRDAPNDAIVTSGAGH